MWGTCTRLAHMVLAWLAWLAVPVLALAEPGKPPGPPSRAPISGETAFVLHNVMVLVMVAVVIVGLGKLLKELHASRLKARQRDPWELP